MCKENKNITKLGGITKKMIYLHKFISLLLPNIIILFCPTNCNSTRAAKDATMAPHAFPMTQYDNFFRSTASMITFFILLVMQYAQFLLMCI